LSCHAPLIFSLAAFRRQLISFFITPPLIAFYSAIDMMIFRAFSIFSCHKDFIFIDGYCFIIISLAFTHSMMHIIFAVIAIAERHCHSVRFIRHISLTGSAIFSSAGCDIDYFSCHVSLRLIFRQPFIDIFRCFA